jgi:hypothetical protein
VQRYLFIVKYREDSGGHCAYDGTLNCYGGLYNSAAFVVQMLNSIGIWARLVQVCDNNGIDAAVDHYKPTTVVIEALWVVPSKFAVLEKLHPKVKWIVRCHSEIPFIAYEGVAMEWLLAYMTHANVSIANNSIYGARDFMAIIQAANPKWSAIEVGKRVKYLPNWYPAIEKKAKKAASAILNIGCFGAIRPLKNHLLQALSAIEFARQLGKKLHFHVNGRTEQGGESVLNNLRALLPGTGNELVEHEWEPRGQFLGTMSGMDVSMQVSFSETFDITAADSAALGIPLVTSNEVTWASPLSQAETTNAGSIVERLKTVTGVGKGLIADENLRRLQAYSKQSEVVWASA